MNSVHHSSGVMIGAYLMHSAGPKVCLSIQFSALTAHIYCCHTGVKCALWRCLDQMFKIFRKLTKPFLNLLYIATLTSTENL